MPVFAILSKKNKLPNITNNEGEQIYLESYRKLKHKKKARCITVSSWDGSYLTSKFFIPTHNTTYSLSLAQRLSEEGFKTCLIDSNLGQDSISKILKVDTLNKFPSIYSLAIGTIGIPSVFVPFKEINKARGGLLEQIGFDTVFAPNNEQIKNNPHIDPFVYRDVFDFAVKNYQMVCIDTQILETTSIYKRHSQIDTVSTNDLLLPILLDKNAWIVGLCDGDNDESVKGLKNIFSEISIKNNRNLIVINNNENVTDEMQMGISNFLKNYGQIVSFVKHNKDINQKMSAGNVPLDINDIRKTVNDILEIVTGLEFAQELPQVKTNDKSPMDLSKISKKIMGLFWG
jgi:hypothetical protein